MEDIVCPTCGDGFDSFRGYSAHNAHHDTPNALISLIGEGELEKLYRTMTEGAIADKLGVNQATVHNALDDLGVDTSNPQHSEYPSLIISQGYERVTHKGWQVLHHRLAAVAWFGFDDVTGNVVHHKNGLSWDTREENIELMKQSDHIKEHGLPGNKVT